MKDIVLLFLIVSTGSLLGIISKKCTYEKMLPITCMTIVFILFAFGLIDSLNVGVVVIVCVSCVAYICFFIYALFLAKQKGIRDITNRLLGTVLRPTTLVFIIFYLLLVVCNYGRVCSNWDEFSHWATVVKQMTLLDTFGSNEKAIFVSFKDYPPAMALFQYFFEKIHIIVNSNGEFSDWYLYFGYQLFLLSIIMPFFDILDLKKPSTYLLTMVLLLSPILIFQDSLKTLYIDSFLGVLAGAGMASILITEDDNQIDRIYVLLVVATIVIVKTVGLLFAITILSGYIISIIPNQNSISKEQLRSATLAATCLLVPFLLWKSNLCVHGTHNTFIINTNNWSIYTNSGGGTSNCF